MKFVINVLRGILIGVANVIPGVSGGTMMVSMGVYDTIISSITGLFKHLKKSIVTLFPYLLGMAVGIVGFSFSIEFLFGRFPLPTAFAFVGLVLGGTPVIFKKVKEPKKKPLNLLIFVLFFALIIGMEFLGSGADKTVTFSATSILLMLLLGALSAAAMVIPGVSGSLLLLALGYYNTVIETINAFVTALLSGDFKAALLSMGILVPFGIGVLLGIFWIAKLIELLLARFEKQTYYAILGLVLASPVSILLNVGFTGCGAGSIAASVITFAAGFAAALRLGKE